MARSSRERPRRADSDGCSSCLAAGVPARRRACLAADSAARGSGELESFLPPPEGAVTSGTATVDGELPWMVNDYAGGLEARSRAQVACWSTSPATPAPTVGGWKRTCSRGPEITRELERFVRVRLYTDGQGELYRQQQQTGARPLRHRRAPLLRRPRLPRHPASRVPRHDARCRGIPAVPARGTPAGDIVSLISRSMYFEKRSVFPWSHPVTICRMTPFLSMIMICGMPPTR